MTAHASARLIDEQTVYQEETKGTNSVSLTFDFHVKNYGRLTVDVRPRALICAGVARPNQGPDAAIIGHRTVDTSPGHTRSWIGPNMKISVTDVRHYYETHIASRLTSPIKRSACFG